MEENAANWVKMQALEIRRARVELGLLLCEFEQITSFSPVFLPHFFIKVLRWVICTIFFTQTSCHFIANSVRN